MPAITDPQIRRLRRLDARGTHATLAALRSGMAAAIDRLVHHSVIVELNVPSYRAEQAKRRRAKAATEATT
jgi:hypothetical protein